MQDIFKQIFDRAVSELPNRLQAFQDEDAVLYRGFKISKRKEGYYWQDTRYSNFYEKVDPKITEKVLENGFALTLNEVMLHNDKDKVLSLSREIEKKDALIAYWAKESTRIWTAFNKRKNVISKDTKTDEETKLIRRATLKERYEKKKDLFHKKRKVISEEREELKADMKFFDSRIKLYNKLKP